MMIMIIKIIIIIIIIIMDYAEMYAETPISLDSH